MIKLCGGCVSEEETNVSVRERRKAMSNDLLTLYRHIRETPALCVDLPEEYGKGRIEHLETNTFSLSSWNLIAEAVPDAV